MPKTLLLADDSVTIQKVVGITFANEDVELVTVDNGDDAITRARQVKPDLVLADIGMPGLNGYELCAAIRRDPNLAHIPVLLLTGTFETYDEEKAREVGSSGHIAKPFEAQALVDRVFQLLAQAPPKAAAPPPPAAPPPKPAPVAAPAQAPPPRPAPPQRPAPPARPVAAAPAPAPPAAPRPRPELPPMPQAKPPAPAPAPRPAPTPPPVSAAPRVPPPSPKREATPFEFELPPVPSAPAARPAPAAPPPPPEPEPVWEAEPEAELLADDSALEAEPAELHTDVSPGTTPPDATRLFAPDLLGRATRLPDVPEPPRPPAARKGDFSFDDLDFEEPTNQPAHQSQIFGESSERGEHKPEFAQALPEAPLEVEALADPLYSQTTFLDPAGARSVSAPPLPDLLEVPEQPQMNDDSQDEIELAEADTALDDELSDSFDPLAKPFSPDTAAALETPRFERGPAPREPQSPRAAEASTRLMLPDDAPTPSPIRVIPPPAPRVSPLVAEADTLPPPARRAPPAPAPAPVPAARASASAIVDSTLLAQSVEKVAWEAFGTLSEQVVGEVLKRVEAVVWEVVPQLCERLIREEIARLKAEMSE